MAVTVRVRARGVGGLEEKGTLSVTQGAQTGGALPQIEPAGQGGSHGTTGRKARPHSGLGRDE